jgi:serine/threonine-protein kinase HipA
LIEEAIEATESVIGEVGNMLPDGFPMDVAEAVFKGMRKQAAGLADFP